VPLGKAGRCRLCLAASRASSTIPTARGGVQLFMLVGTPAAVRPWQPAPSRPAPLAGLGQLRLSQAAAARTAARPSPGRRPGLRPADPLGRSEHRGLLAVVVGYGQARGWSPSTLRRVQHSLAALLASQPTPAWPLEAAAVRQFLLERHLTALRVVEFLADQGLVRVDEHAALDRWLARRLALLPAPIRAEVQVWIEGLRGRGARAGRRRRAATIQGYVRAVTPALVDWSARYQSLRQVTTEDIAARLEPLAGPTRKLTLVVLRSLFRTLKARRLAFTNPTAGLAAPGEPPPPALGLDPIRRAGLLGQLDRPDQQLVVLLAGVHALRPHQIRLLGLDAVDLGAGTLRVGGRPRRLDALTLKALGRWLELRRVRWPASANPYLLVNQSTAGGLTPVTRGYVQQVFGRLGVTAEDLRVDRLLAEVHDSGGDPLKLTEFFGITEPTAIRYCLELDPPSHPGVMSPATSRSQR
jgi:integrase